MLQPPPNAQLPARQPVPPAADTEHSQPIIRFRCEPCDMGIIAPPRPAKHDMPDWFRKLPPVAPDLLSVTNNGLTVKRCLPFLDAMTTGWIIPLAATIRMEVTDGGATANCGWDFDRQLVSNHTMGQVEGHPRLPRPPTKFHNFWTIATPPGWSCLFVPPLNRPHDLFEAASGIVDTDTYQGLIHFPFFPTAPEGLHVLPKGTPIVQVIPFRRDASALAMHADIGPETAEDEERRVRIHRNVISEEGWYRTQARAVR